MMTPFVYLRTKAASHRNVTQNFNPENTCSSEKISVDDTKPLIQTFKNATKGIYRFLHQGDRGSRPDHIYTEALTDFFSSFHIHFQTDGKSSSCTTKMF
jgi:hypothetical protein